VVLLAVVSWVIRKRLVKPHLWVLLALAMIVVLFGMVFARYTHVFMPHLHWEVFYGVSAMVTFLLPPLWLRMSHREIARYLPFALLMAPMIHVVFSLVASWHDYMPCPVYISSLVEILRSTLPS
jgi:hypothetical protein